MVAVRLARGWIGYGGAVHRAGEFVDVDAVTLARLEASGVVTPSESTGESTNERDWAGPTGGDDDDERTVAWAGPTNEPDDDEDTDWAGPTGGNV
jgi:hypothetical protein